MGKLHDKARFQFGKYRNTLFSKNNDIDYLRWYYRKTNAPRALKRILKLDNSLGFYENEILPKKDIESIISVKKNIEVFKKMNLAILTFKKNPNYDGIYDHFGMKLKFPDVRLHEYNGYPYYLPVIDGKCKRVKNKKFKIFAIPITTEAETIFHIRKLQKIK